MVVALPYRMKKKLTAAVSEQAKTVYIALPHTKCLRRYCSHLLVFIMVNFDLAASIGRGKDAITCRTPSEAGSCGQVSTVAVVRLAGPTCIPHEPASSSHCSDSQGVGIGPVCCQERRSRTVETHHWEPGLQVIEADSSSLLGNHHLLRWMR